jgi:hypothetical protein
LSRYVTISVLRGVKELLEKEKGNRDWSSFPLKLYREAKASRARAAFEKPRQTLSVDDLDKVLESSREFRKGSRYDEKAHRH